MSEVISVNLENPAQAVVEAQAGQGEQLLAGKFKTSEELVKAYTELEKKLGSRPASPNPADTAVTAAKVGDTITPAAPSAPVELDLTPFEKEWETNGKLSDASYDKLAKDNKIGRKQVDEFIAYRQAKVEQFRNEVYNSVGGQENFTQMLDWAKANLSPEDQAAYDSAMASNNPGVIKLAVQGVHARFSQEFGQSPTLIGGRAGSAGVAPFRSTDEVVKAMSDPRYDSDEAYRADIERRLEVSEL